MQKKIIIAGIILAIALGLLISPHIRLFKEDYGTGLDIDTTTRKIEIYGHYNVKGKKIFYTDPNWEQLDSEVYIASWMPDEYSTKIVTTAKFYLAGHRGGICPYCWQDIYFGQYFWVVQYIDTNNHWHTIINGENNWIDTNYVSIIQGDISGNIPGKKYYPDKLDIIKGNVFGEDTWTHVPFDGEWEWEHLQTSTLVFAIKGNRIGAIRVYCVLEYAEMNGNVFLGGVAYPGELLASEDWAYLAPGIGRVDVLGVNALRQEGNVTTEPTGREVPLYVFEEGSEVIFEVDTGYAGAVAGKKGWRLAVYKADRPEPLAVWWLDDDLRNYEVRWKIPEGTFTPGGNNRMTVVLTNTIIDQAEKTFFVVDKIEHCPGSTTIIPDKEKYVKGDVAHVTLRADANPKTKIPIKQFYFEAKYGSEYSTDYAIKTYVPATHVEGLTYEGKVSFTITKGDKKLYMLAWAIDEEGRAGGRGERMVETETGYGNYKLTIYVQEPDGTPIKNAEVRVDNLPPRYTDDEGKVIFWVKYGSHHYKVHKSGYYDTEGDVEVVGQMKIVVTLRPKWQPPEMNLLAILSAVAIIGFGTFIGVKIYKERKKYGKK